MRIRPMAFALAGILSLTALACADTIVLKDGTILGGVVKQVKDGYEITNPDGKATVEPSDMPRGRPCTGSAASLRDRPPPGNACHPPMNASSAARRTQ